MNPDWRALAPHRPLDPGSEQYVPSQNPQRLADWLRASPSTSTILFGGPVGVGKSTDLAAAAALLQNERFSCLVQLDRAENMRRITPERMLLRITEQVSLVAASNGLLVSRNTKRLIDQALGSAQPTNNLLFPGGLPTSERALAVAVLAEVRRLAPSRRMTLLIDGLEKVPEGSVCAEIFEALGQLGDETDLVVVVPWHIAYGPRADAVIRPGERFWAGRAVAVEDQGDTPGRAFLFNILLKRLQLDPNAAPHDFWSIADNAARMSGGLPRTFLQLVADAATYAQLRRNSEWPADQDLAGAIADQQDSFRRMLLPGDIDAIKKIVGTDGLELDLARKVRLLAHGVLLESSKASGLRLDVHPLLRSTILGSSHA